MGGECWWMGMGGREIEDECMRNKRINDSTMMREAG